MFHSPMRAAVALFLCAGCAQGIVGEPDGGRTDVDATAPKSDVSGGQRDMGGPPPVDMAINPCSVCCPGDKMCLEDGSLGTCNAAGTDFDPVACGEGLACVDGACIIPPVCMPGALDCADDNTVLRCRQTGEGWVSLTCESGLVCSEGVCTDKLPLASQCTADDECAGGKCRCDATDGCPAGLGTGICTNATCTANSCGMVNGCLASDVVPIGLAAQDYDHCVKYCGDGSSCPAGSRCAGLPARTADGWDWFQGCYFSGVEAIGDACQGNSTCVGGLCLGGYIDGNLCTRNCADDGKCPDGSACVELMPGQFLCALTCGDGSLIGSEPCPLDVPDERFDVDCSVKSSLGGGGIRVCTKTGG